MYNSLNINKSTNKVVTKQINKQDVYTLFFIYKNTVYKNNEAEIWNHFFSENGEVFVKEMYVK